MRSSEDLRLSIPLTKSKYVFVTLPAQCTVMTVKMVSRNVSRLKSYTPGERYASAEPNSVGTRLADSDHGLSASRYVLIFIRATDPDRCGGASGVPSVVVVVDSSGVVSLDLVFVVVVVVIPVPLVSRVSSSGLDSALLLLLLLRWWSLSRCLLVAVPLAASDDMFVRCGFLEWGT